MKALVERGWTGWRKLVEAGRGLVRPKHVVLARRVLAGALVTLAPLVARAGALPWDRGLNAIGSTLTGAVAIGVAVIAIAAVGLGSAVNADLGGATQRIMSVVIIISMVGGASVLVGNLGLGGGLVP